MVKSSGFHECGFPEGHSGRGEQIYYRNDRNLGLVGNFNRAVSLADGEYAVLVHDDDYLFPAYLSEMNRITDLKTDAASRYCSGRQNCHSDSGIPVH